MTSADVRTSGQVAELFELVIDLSKVREMCKVLEQPLPEGEAARVPTTFLTTMRHWISDGSDAWRLLGFDRGRTLHAGEEYEFHAGPLRIGQRLTGQSRIGRRWSKENKSGQTLHFATMVTEYRDQAGTLVATATLTGVELPGDES